MSKLATLLVSIPGRTEKRGVLVDEGDQWPEIERKVAAVWCLPDLTGCALFQLEGQYESAINNHFSWNLFVISLQSSALRSSTARHLELRKHARVPSQLELCTPHFAATQVLTAINASCESMKTIAAQLTTASNAQAAELAKLKEVNQAQAKELVELKAAFLKAQKQHEEAVSQTASRPAALEKTVTADWKDQVIKDLQAKGQTLEVREQALEAKVQALETKGLALDARLSDLESSHGKSGEKAASLQSQGLFGKIESDSSTAPPKPAATHEAPQLQATDSSAATIPAVREAPIMPQFASAATPTSTSPVPMQRTTTPPQPTEPFETLARSLAYMIDGAFQQEATTLLEAVLKFTGGLAAAAPLPSRGPASPHRTSWESHSVSDSRASASHPTSNRQSSFQGVLNSFQHVPVDNGSSSFAQAQAQAALPRPATPAQAQKDKIDFEVSLQADSASSKPSPAESVTVASSNSSSEDEFEMVEEATAQGKADSVIEKAANRLVGTFESMMAEMREVRADSHQPSSALKRKGKATEASLQAQQCAQVQSINRDALPTSTSSAQKPSGRFAFHEELN